MKKLIVRGSSALYGAIVHVLLLGAYIHWVYNYPPPPGVNHRLVWIGVGGLGGVYAAVLLPRLALKGGSQRLRAVRGGLFGILVTFLTCVTFGIIAALYLTVYFRSTSQFVEPIINTFLITMPGVLTICMLSFVHSIPFDFAYGALAGICVPYLTVHGFGRRASV